MRALWVLMGSILACACFSGPAPDTENVDRGGETLLLLTGDVMLGRGIDQIQPHSVDPVLFESYMKSAVGYVEIAEEESGRIPRDVAPAYVWGDALEVLARFDPPARIINLETAVTAGGEPWPDKGIHYRMHPANVAILTAAQIDCAVLANNHVVDWGWSGLVETLASLRNAGVKPVGAGADLAEAAEPAIVEVPDGRILVFAMAHQSSGVPREWAALPGTGGVHLLPDLSGDTARLTGRTIRAWPRRASDRVIVSIHWGGNWGYPVPADQERFARTLIEEGGVDLVHGHSSHHPKGMEVHRGRLILYGAGDLVNDYEGIGGRKEYRPELSLLYLPKLAPSGELQSMRLVPMRMERFRLNHATAAETEWLRERIARESRGLRFTIDEDGTILAEPAGS